MVAGVCTGVEALLRRDHCELGAISPAEFIPLVEQTSMIHPVTDRVIRAALRQAGEWQRQALDLTAAINLSAGNLVEADLTDRFARGMEREGVATGRH